MTTLRGTRKDRQAIAKFNNLMLYHPVEAIYDHFLMLLDYGYSGNYVEAVSGLMRTCGNSDSWWCNGILAAIFVLRSYELRELWTGALIESKGEMQTS